MDEGSFSKLRTRGAPRSIGDGDVGVLYEDTANEKSPWEWMRSEGYVPMCKMCHYSRHIYSDPIILH